MAKTSDSLRRLAAFVTEREAVRVRKDRGDPRPWTKDPILGTYRFCNVRRMDDKVSRWLTDNWYGPYAGHPNMLAAVALARFFNLPASLHQVTGWVLTPNMAGRHHEPYWEQVKSVLRQRKAVGETVFNGAYMVRGMSKATKDKITIVVDEYVRPMLQYMVQSDGGWLVNPSSMEGTWSALQGCHGFGSFMAGQVTADLRWAVAGKWKDKLTWAPVGPGSARGLARLIKPDDDWRGLAAKFAHDQELWLASFRGLVLEWLPPLLPRDLAAKLEAMDYQSCLCEWDKYERTRLNEGRPKQLYRPGSSS